MLLSKRTVAVLLIGGGVMAGGLASELSARLVFGCGAIDSDASAEFLQKAFGTDDITIDSLPLGDTEGDMVAATAFFASDARRRIEVVWKDPARSRSPKYIQLGHEATDWKTPQGITIGTSLKERERLNGRPFRLAGFDFDGSGAVLSWGGGKLGTLTSTTCDLQMNLDSLDAPSSVRQKWVKQVTGDHELSSGHPAMQALNPRISSLRLAFR